MENTNKKHFKAIIIGILCTVIACAATVGGIIWALNKDDSGKDKSAQKGKDRTQTVSNDEDDIEKLANTNTGFGADDIFAGADKSGYVIPAGALKPGDYSGTRVKDDYDSDGLPIPDLRDGEQLYIGYGDLEGAGIMKFAFCVSADNKSVRYATMVIGDFSNPFHGKTLQFSNMSRHGENQLVIDSSDEQMLWESKVDEVVMYKDVLHVKLSDYSMPTFPDNQVMHLGEVNIWLKKVTE